MTDENGALKYIELQNRAEASIDTRSAEYFGLGIGHSKGKPADQIWLLAEDVDSLLDAKMFSRHILNDEATGKAHPNNSGILYVSLTRLASEDTPAGELALFLLGRISDPTHDVVKNVADVFKASFNTFRDDKEVAHMLTLKERGWREGRQEGLHEGRHEGVNVSLERLTELLERGYSLDEAKRIIREEEGILEGSGN